MTGAERRRLWRRLTEAGLVEGPPPVVLDADRPWFVRVMMGLAGWLGALFLLGFVAVGFAEVVDSASGSVILGVVLVVSAVVIFRSRAIGDFANQFAFAVSLAGQMLVLVGLINGLSGRGLVVAAFMLVLELALFGAVPDFTHRVWTAAMAAVALLYALLDTGLQPLVPAVLSALAATVWLGEFRFPSHLSATRALGYGLVAVSLVLGTGGDAWWGPDLEWLYTDPGIMAGEAYHRLGAGLAGLVLIAVVLKLLSRVGLQPLRGAGRPVFAAGAAVALAGIMAPGLAVAPAVLLMGFGHGNRVLMGLGAAGLLAYLGQYYYFMEVTLLYKSLLLMATGAALLAARWVLLSRSPGTDRAEATRG